MTGIALNGLGDLARLTARAARFSLREPRTALMLLRMTGWVGAASLMIKSLPLPLAMKVMTPLRRRRHRRRGPTGADADALKARVAGHLDMLLAADVLFLTPTCWKRAPVLYRLLALHGIETRVVFGVRKEGEGLLAGHAWLEEGGRPVLEKSPPRYTVTFSFPAPPAPPADATQSNLIP